MWRDVALHANVMKTVLSNCHTLAGKEKNCKEWELSRVMRDRRARRSREQHEDENNCIAFPPLLHWEWMKSPLIELYIFVAMLPHRRLVNFIMVKITFSLTSLKWPWRKHRIMSCRVIVERSFWALQTNINLSIKEKKIILQVSRFPTKKISTFISFAFVLVWLSKWAPRAWNSLENIEFKLENVLSVTFVFRLDWFVLDTFLKTSSKSRCYWMSSMFSMYET